MNNSTYAKIIDVKVNYDKKWDYEDRKPYTTKSYSYVYEYTVNGDKYTGYGHSKHKVRDGQRIKVYYNELAPEKSEATEKHNKYLKRFIFIIIFIIIILYLLENQ